MNSYDKQKYSSLLVKGNLHDAIKYLEVFSEYEEISKKYNDIFKCNNELVRSENEIINELDLIYQKYYKEVFWHKRNLDEAENRLFENLWEFCGSDRNLEKNSYIEDEVEKIVRREGYEFLGGDTAGYYGPYIWSSSIRESYDVELPSGTEKYSVIMMDGFISRSWLDFLSFGKVGTGGWIGKDGTLCCVSSVYDIESLDFKISFLKHEAQHGYDKRRFTHITSAELEYRAKLVELVYWEDDKVMTKFHSEADSSDLRNTHSIASHRIVNDLSKRIFDIDYESSISRFTENLDIVKEVAKELLNEDTVRLSEEINTSYNTVTEQKSIQRQI